MRKYSVKAIFIVLFISFHFYGRSQNIIKIDKVDAHSNFPTVTLTITLASAQISPSELTAQNFTLLEDGKEVEILKITPLKQETSLSHIIIAIDTSRSIPLRHFEKMMCTVRTIINTQGIQHKMSILRFNDYVTALGGFHHSKEQLIAHVNALKQQGTKTLLYSAIRDALIRLRDVNAKTGSVVVFTDGKDEGSPIGKEEIIAFAKEAKYPIHFVCPSEKLCAKDIERIATETGGSVYPSLEKFNTTFAKTADASIKNEILLQFASNSTADGKIHHLELRFSKGLVSDRAFASFTAPSHAIPLQFPRILDVLLVVLIIVLIVLISILIAFLIRMGNKLFALTINFSREKKVPSLPVHNDDELKHKYPPTLTPQDPEYAYSKAWLIMKDGPESGKKFPIFWDEVTLGRDETNSIVVADGAVSLKHAKIKRIKDTYMLFDLVSENGTYLNGKKLLRPKVLCDWDEIKIGRTVFIFRGSKLKD